MTATLTRLFVYPVKSLGGIELAESAVESRGLRYDRRWMVTDEDGVFFTQRKHPRMALVSVELRAGCLAMQAEGMPELTAPLEAAPDAPKRTVQIWHNVCEAVSVTDGDAWFTEYLGSPCRLVYMPESTRREVNPRYSQPGDIVSFADGYPILAVSEASLQELNSRLEQPLPMDRFRPNLVVSGVGAFAEDQWTRAETAAVALRGAKPCGRCAITTVDQQTGEPCGPEPLRTLAHYRRDPEGEVLFGQNLIVDRPGVLRVGDVFEVVSEPGSFPVKRALLRSAGF